MPAPLKFNLSIFAEEDPDIYQMLALMSSSVERGRRIRALIRAGFLAERHGYQAAPGVLTAHQPQSTPQPAEPIPSIDPLDGLDVRAFRFGGDEASA